jgi:predicted TIM-barrel fold metal-dependent hydrolase
MIHMGGPLSAAAVEVAQENPNVTLVGSECPKPNIIAAIRTLGANRIAFGSDNPFCLLSAELGAYEAMLKDEGFSQEEHDLIMYKNIKTLFEL